MKRIFKYLVVLLVLCLGSEGIKAQTTTSPTLRISAVTLQPGQTQDCIITLNDEITFAGMNMDVTLPEGVSVEAVNAIGSISGWNMIFNANSPTLTKITAFNLTSDVTTSGEIIQLTLKAADNIENTINGQISVSGIDFSTKTGTEFAGMDTSASCTVIIPALSIAIEPQLWSMKVDETKILQVIFTPEGTTNKSVTWNSNAPTICSVEDGLIKGLGVGVAEITATDTYGNSSKCQVTINPWTASSVVVSPSSSSIMVGQKTKLTAQISPENVTDKTIVWTSESQDIAIVGDTGEVTGLKKGIAVIKATCGDVSGECVVTVYDNTDVTVNPGSGTTEGNQGNTPAENTTSGGSLTGSDLTLRVNQKGTVSLQLPEGLQEQPTLEWSLADEGDNIVTLTNTSNTVGTFQAKNMGTTTYTVKISGTSTVLAQGTVTVIAENPMTSLSLDPESISVAKNIDPFVIKAQYTPETANPSLLAWTSSEQSVATVDNGTVTILTEGKTTITASARDGSNLSANCEITVTAPVDTGFKFDFSGDEDLTGDAEGITLYLGDKYQFKPKAQDGYALPDNITWTTDPSTVVSVTATGEITALEIGEATVTASASFNNQTISASCKVTVVPVPASSITLNSNELHLFIGQETTLEAKVMPENTTHKTVTWETDQESIVSVTQEGKITAIAPGVANITVTCGSATASCKVTVLAITASSISLNVEDQTIYVGATTQLKATVSPDNTTDKTFTWSSDNPGVATIDSNGLVTAITVGTAKITATCGSVSASCVIKVEPRPTAPITVTTSQLNISAIDGSRVLMWVSTEGGNDNGWSFAWTYNGETVATDRNLEVTVHNSNNIPVTETYSVVVSNVSDGVTIYSETFNFTIEIWPAVSLSFGEGADSPDQIGNNNGTTQDSDGWWQRNGIHIETLRTWEGKNIGMWCEQPSGGYSEGWQYAWSINENSIGDSQEITYTAAMAEGDGMEISSQTPLVTYRNFGPSGDLWAQFAAYGPTLDVYRRPQTPLQMLRDADASSNTFSAVMTLSDAQLAQYEYQFVFGYTDSDGSFITLGTSKDRYYTPTTDIYNNSSYEFWVYTIWRYPDGSVVSSGLRYLNGAVDEDFNASSFSGVSSVQYDNDGSIAIYSLSGYYLGKQATDLAPGIYIKVTIVNGEKRSQKFVVR